MTVLFAFLFLIFTVVFIFVKAITGGLKNNDTNHSFQAFNDPGNFVNPFNEYNK